MVSARPKILVARIGAIGDICMLMPLVKALSRRFEVHWLIRAVHMPVVRSFPELTCRLIGVTVGPENEPFSRQDVAALADQNYDFFLDFSHWPSITWLAERLSAIPVRAMTVDPLQDALLGIAVDAERQAQAFNCLVPVPAGLHQLAKWQRLVKAACGVDIEPEWPLPEQPGIATDRRLRVFLHPHSGKPEKVWPAKRFAETLAGLAKRQPVECVINRARGHIVRELRWRLLLSRVRTRIVELDPSFRTLHDELGRCDVAFGCDSGPMHFASLMGVPTIVIYGRYPAAEFAPAWRSIAISPPRPETDTAAVTTRQAASAFEQFLVDRHAAAA